MFKIKYNAGSTMSYGQAAVLAKEEANVVRHGEKVDMNETFVAKKEFPDSH